jgi:hypothetical protein
LLFTNDFAEQDFEDRCRYLKFSADNVGPQGQLTVAWMSEHGIDVFPSVDLIAAIRNFEPSTDGAIPSVVSIAGFVSRVWEVKTGDGFLPRMPNR